MKNVAKHVPGLIALVASMAVASATAAELSADKQDPSDPGAAVAPIRYESFLPPKAAIARDTSPADNWKEANRTVGAIDSMSLTMTMPHSEEGAAATKSDPHAGHEMSPAPAADPHAGHQMPQKEGQKAPAKKPAAKPAAPHAGHKTPTKKVADPHAGHVMPPAAPDPHAGHAGKEKK